VSAIIDSTKTGYSYSITIYLPASYDTNNASYPTIYALDADARFVPPDTRFTNLRNILERRGTDAILIGISGTERRQTDYNMPGAIAYHDFLTSELIPYVESRFRADASKRMVSGLSTSGNFPVLALFMEASNNLVFSYFITAEAAVWQQLDVVNRMEDEMFERVGGKTLSVTLIVARSAGDVFNGSIGWYVNGLYEKMAAHHYQGLRLTQPVFPYGHAEMGFPSFEDAIVRILG